ncbi:MAG: tRNA (adenosine(37)-N6)-threonylcarbamoyltransferase complex ATPase subunit type 1 TsaE [Simkaniaceae bacterium]|nr:tRNA (adenosine(37)-N6)-threonylcarbamoyltransferase complex ATPase subunit type 1 TsaE [Simkaniaceae bacterium]
MGEQISYSEEETLEIGKKLAQTLTPGTILCLEGPLGAGKTTLAKGIISGLTGCDPFDVTSPTFGYLHAYGPVRHFDLYRLTDSEQFFTMGFDEEWLAPNITLIEWPTKLGAHLPEGVKWLHLQHAENGRKISYEV